MLSSCGLFNEGVSFDNVQRGMTREELINLCGSPYAKSFYKNEEELTYLRHRYTDGSRAPTLYHVKLENDTVVGMETELLPPPPKPTVVIKEVEKKQ